jgi:tetratricopeptide (TPR) repeat protein
VEVNPAERISELFEQALQLPTAERGAFLDELAAHDPAAYTELHALLGSHTTAPDYLDRLADRVLPAALRGATETALPDQYVGRAIGRYQIVQRIGGGGMGVVYKAHDRTLDRPVALKFLSPHLGADPEARSRLIAEARAASALDHPNIAVVHEIGTIQADEDESGADRLFIAMGYYAGRTLKQSIAEGTLSLDDALNWGAQLAAGLARAHEAGIVHRDIKPANVIVGERGEVRIVDFGLVKLAGLDITGEGVTPGTIAYMSPEQLRGDRVDARTDVWSAGVVLYEMIAGTRPFRGDRDAVVIAAIRNDEPAPLLAVRPEVPEALGGIVERCLRKDAAARFSDGGELSAALERVREQLAHRATPADRTGLPGPGRRRRILLGTVLVVAAAAALLFTRPGPQPVDSASSASTILVLPFLPPPGDTALARLGRDLVITLSATLDGLGDFRTVDASTVFAHMPDDGAGSFDPDRGAELARRLGAGRLLVGSLAGNGPAIRADARILTIGGANDINDIVRASADVQADSLFALTDSLTLGLVRGLLSGRDGPIPSLGALTTRSVPALRAYVDGEQSLASGDMGRAVAAFDRAFAADSTFWFAYWRSLYPRVYERTGADQAVLADVIRHRDELPERDRLLIEARMEPTVGGRQAALKSLAERYDSYWPAAWELANLQVHWTPPLGTTLADSRASLERVVALNPRFAAAWSHLFLVAAFQGDVGRARSALEALERLVDPREPRWEATLLDSHTMIEALENGGNASPERETAITNLFRRLVAQVPGASWGRAGAFTPVGLAPLQIRLNRRLLASEPVQSHAADLRMGTAMTWAARGAWDSAAVELDAWRGVATDPRDALRAYGFGVIATLVGAWDDERVAALRRAAVNAAAVGDADDRGELAWLDGVHAYSRADTAGLLDARNRVQRSGGSRTASLDQSLAGLEQALRGDESTAARTLERVELNDAEAWAGSSRGSRHPYLTTINRLHAGRWLLADGDTTGALRILQWWQALPGTEAALREGLASWPVIPFVLIEQARIADARGRVEEATLHYLRIVRLYDLPSMPQGAAILTEATNALERLTETGR